MLERHIPEVTPHRVTARVLRHGLSATALTVPRSPDFIRCFRGVVLSNCTATSLRINWPQPSPHRNSTAPMPGLMISVEFRLHPVASAVRVIGHRRHVWLLSMEQEPDPMSPHRWRPQPAVERNQPWRKPKTRFWRRAAGAGSTDRHLTVGQSW